MNHLRTTKRQLLVTAYFCSLALMMIFLNSCSTVTSPFAIWKTSAGVGRSDTIHTVAPGETLWRISKMYDVPAEVITSRNNLGSSSLLKQGQRLVIPGAAPIQPVISVYSSRKWDYIIIHHSATEDGDSLDLNRMHQSKGWDSVGYDFVIDNGTKGKQDGQIETSPRWLKQLDGAHCKASEMNVKGIGICLVGNFSKENVSEKQMESLVYLVNILRKHYGIPEDHILGHGQVQDAKTECPGKYFPWSTFRNRS